MSKREFETLINEAEMQAGDWKGMSLQEALGHLGKKALVEPYLFDEEFDLI